MTQNQTQNQAQNQTAPDKAAANQGALKPRPLSPHLQIYRWRAAMLVSILHRATGMILAGGFFLLAWWLFALAEGEAYFDMVSGFAAHPIGKLALFGILWALLQHLASGIRHLIMDTGALFDLKANALSARLTLVFSLIAAPLVAAYVLFNGLV